MATVAIWKVSSSLKQVINYTTNENKTDLSNYKNSDKSLEYIKDEFKTEKSLFITGINCNYENAFEEMVDVKKSFHKTEGILGFHAYQSYKENEVTPEQAHEIGLRVAEEMWGDRFQVVVSTHLNTKHYHNHFVINSVSFVDGKRYYDNHTTYAEFRRISNEICSEYGLSVLKEKKTKSGINYLNFQNKNVTYNNYYTLAKEDLDIAIMKAHNYTEFLNILKNMGYSVINRSGKLSIKGKNYKRNIRIERYFGEDYSIENIIKQIQGLYSSNKEFYHRNRKPKPNLFATILHPKYNSFYGMYMRYCSILNIYPDYVKKNYISPSIREDIKELDKLSSQAILLATNNIETEEQFFLFLNSKSKQLEELKDKREKLSKDNSTDKKELDLKIKELRQELKMCEDIRTRHDSIKSKLKLLEEDKEMIKNEYIK